MNYLIIVLIAAVTINCLVTTINGKEANDTLKAPYIDTLLPPLKDEPDNRSKEAASAKINSTTKATSVYKSTTKVATTATTTKKPLNNDENNILPELSVEALLPPLFEAKIEKEETTISAPTATKVTTTSRATTTTTTVRPTYNTTKRITILAKPIHTTTTTTSKPNLKLPDLFLDALQPPLLDNSSADVKDERVASTTTTKKPITITTQKLYHQQQIKHLQTSAVGNETKNYNKPAIKSRNVGVTHTHGKQVSSSSQQHDNKLKSKDKINKHQYVAKQKDSNSNYVAKQINYNFDLYLGSTTPRPSKSGLPTITPFPRRLGR